MTYKFSRFARASVNGSRVVISNVQSGNFTKITKECYDILQQWLELGLTEEEFFLAFEDAEDRDYFADLLKILKDHEMLVSRELEEKLNINSISVEITHRCNLACRHCAASAGTMREPEKLNTVQMKQLLEQVARLNPLEITITGGEPMVREDLIELMEHLKGCYNGAVTIMTNGTLLNEENVKRFLPYFDGWSLSIDGVDEETCAAVRGKGVFDKVIGAIHLLKKEGAENIALSMVETTATQGRLTEFNEMCEALGVMPMVRDYNELGRGLTNAGKLNPRRSVGSKQTSGDGQDLFCRYVLMDRCYNCGACEREFQIDPSGDVYPCGPLTAPEFRVCNVLQQEDFVPYILSENYKNSEGYQNLSFYTPDNLPECKDCPNSTLCWRCLYDTTVIYKDRAVFEEWCRWNKEELEELWK